LQLILQKIWNLIVKFVQYKKYKKIKMAARYQQQMNIALERLDQGLARVHSMIKRGKNADAIYYMENDLKDLYGELQNIINIEPGDSGNKIGHLR
jgi:hypothetical protein